MKRYEIEAELKKLNLLRLRLVANGESDLELESKIKNFQGELDAIELEQNNERVKKEDADKQWLADNSLKLHERLNSSIFEKEIPDVYPTFLLLLSKEHNLKFGGSSDQGEFVIKKKEEGENFFELRYSYFCYDKEEVEFTFRLDKDVNVFLQSIEFLSLNAEAYQSNFGHGSTVSVEYDPVNAIFHVFRAFKKYILQ